MTKKKKYNIETLKNLAEIFAFCFAGLYFIYQMGNTLDTTSMGIEVETLRTHKADTTDYLILNVKLNNGPVALVRLENIIAEVYELPNSNKIDSFTFKGTDKKKPKCKNELYKIAAEESTQFSDVTSVHSDKAYRIEVLIEGKRRKFFFLKNTRFQATSISVPYIKDESEDIKNNI